MGQTSTSGQRLTNTNQGKLSVEDVNGRLIVTDENNKVRLLAGYDDNGQIVVKLAQSGFDVRTASADNLIFSSDHNLFKIVTTNSFQYTPPNSGSPLYTVSEGRYKVTVPHQQSGEVAVLAYFSSTRLAAFNNGGFTIMPILDNNGTLVIFKAFYEIDDINIYFYFDFVGDHSGSIEEVFTVKYFIMTQTIGS